MTVYLATKTTGVDPNDDELLDVAIINDRGLTLVQTLVRPTQRTEWPNAAASCGVSSAMIATAPTLEAIMPVIRATVASQVLVAYDVYRMLALLGDALAGAAAVCSAGEAFAGVAADFDETDADETGWSPTAYPPLSLAAKCLLFDWPPTSHRALVGAQACRAVWRYLTDDDERDRVLALRAEQDAELAAVHELELDEKTAIYCANEWALLQATQLFENLGLRPPNTGTNFDAVSQRSLLTRRREDATVAFTGLGLIAALVRLKTLRRIKAAAVRMERLAMRPRLAHATRVAVLVITLPLGGLFVLQLITGGHVVSIALGQMLIAPIIVLGIIVMWLVYRCSNQPSTWAGVVRGLLADHDPVDIQAYRRLQGASGLHDVFFCRYALSWIAEERHAIWRKLCKCTFHAPRST